MGVLTVCNVGGGIFSIMSCSLFVSRIGRGNDCSLSDFWRASHETVS